MIKIWILIAQACLISLMYGFTEGCSCLSSHPQNIVCGADFIMVAKILSIETKAPTTPFSFSDVNCTTRVIIPVKNSPDHGTIFNFKTAHEMALECGVSYSIGSIELLIGHGDRISMCDILFGPTLPQLSYIFSTQMRSSYLKNCGCKIDDGSVFPKPPARESCTPPTDTTAKACYEKQGLCIKVGRGVRSRCIWKNVNGC